VTVVGFGQHKTRWIYWVWTLTGLASCTFADLDVSKKGCPCANGYVCQAERCIRSSELTNEPRQDGGSERKDAGNQEEGGRLSRDASPPGDGVDGSQQDGSVELVSSKSCEATGVSCAASKPYCDVFFSSGEQAWVSECQAKKVEVARNEPCAVSGGLKCGDGLACSWSVGTGYNVCTPLCSSHGDCPSDTPYCAYPVGAFGIGMCSTCIVTEDDWLWEDCENGQVCQAKGGPIASACGVAGAKTQGESCTAAADCAKGTMCVCKGGAKVGDECTAESDGVCRAACWPWSVNKVDDCKNRLANSTCSGITSSLKHGQPSLSYCKPN